MSELTNEQTVFSTYDNAAFLHACPGAGKTNTILARLAEIAATLPPRHGVAVLSFTNSAVDEFRERSRTAGLAACLKLPNFIGTLDAFVRHFVVMPYCSKTSAIRPIIVDSWNTLDIEIRLSGQYSFPGEGVSLDEFDSETNVINPGRIRNNALQNHVRQHQARYQQVAMFRRRRLLQAGYMSASDARAQTQRLIRDPASSDALGRALAARFHEIMVDEGQDCNPLDLQILSWLRQYGVRVTFVCDPDQAIYEFRNGNPEGLREFKATYPAQSHLKLTGNFRSSPAICRLAATLRSVGQIDESVGASANIENPILLLTYAGRSPSAAIGQAFLEQVTAIGVATSNAIILAHSGKDAQRAASGLVSDNTTGKTRISSLARIVAEFWSTGATARSREASVQAVEVLLLDLMGLRQDGEHLLRAIERGNLDRRAHRRRALCLLMSLPKACGDTDADRLAWIANVHTETERLSVSLPQGTTMRGFFRKPPNNQWSHQLKTAVELGLPCAKIHEAKGHEYDAVCLVIPPNRAPDNRTEALFHSWENRIDVEAKRVIYVGVTRARKLAVLALPIAFADRCAALLNADQVPHDRRDL